MNMLLQRKACIDTTKKEYKRSNRIFDITVLVLSVISFMLILLIGVRSEISKIWLLPFCFSIGFLLIVHKGCGYRGLAYYIINSTMFARYSLTPVLSIFNDYYYGIVSSTDNIDTALYLMIFEMIAVMIVEYICLKYSSKEKHKIIDNKSNHSGLLQFFFIAFFIGITAVAIIIYPSARNSLFNFSYSYFRSSQTELEEMNGFFFVFFRIGISVIYAFLIKSIASRVNNNTNSFVLSFIVSILYISSSWAGSGGISRWGLITSGATSLIVLLIEYPSRKKFLFVTGGLSFGIIILLSSLTKLFIHHGVVGAEALTEIFSESYFNSYFQGVYSVSTGIEAMNFASDKIGIVTFLDDTISAYPILNHLFYQSGNSTELFYCDYIARSDQILPTICQGYAYLGVVGSPLFSITLTFFSFKCDSELRRSDNLYRTVALAQIVTWTSLFMAVNIYIIQRTTMYYVLLLIILWIDKHVKVGKR